ncbi:glutaminyl-tRNA synthetase [Thecamonas trahens ATCC 50062]|uniref:glutamine--tRNA ligase n=1 Tax=Thecamonas trahens ATCC 50062 TaxID=461836 RepID=A0A0L0DGD3_THETB|nr:glutaminyl-tRNA synthetase [Thecamonas trahens ATCC 50062]KNC50403.1 glutaminyl-tRNA synthetase [Thecamonas trahens ATCC 50062]|eukprot:XP_013756945.1 glutaminyl-tRNA synthetase [Thecamonas trahens ATCC 50062]
MDAKAVITELGCHPDTLNNTKLTQLILELHAVVGTPATPSACNMLYEVAAVAPKHVADIHLPFLAGYVADERIRKPQFAAATKWLKKNKNVPVAELDVAAFEKASGVGVSYTDEQIGAAVAKTLEAHAEELQRMRYHMKTGKLLGQTTRSLPFVDGARVKNILDAKIAETLGPRTAFDDGPPPAAPVKGGKGKGKGKGGKGKGKGKGNEAGASAAAEVAETTAEKIVFSAPEENEQDDPKLLAEHLATTGGKVVTRFPPEPNGFPHIGHAKSMGLNFGYAKAKGGICYLRYDDTNPEAEKPEYYKAIREAVAWLGHEPVAVTKASDYFEQMYAYAEQLILSGHAYVCHQNKAEIVESRQKRTNSPWRDRPAAESLKLFRDMRKGKIGEGEATLRLKMDMQSDNPCMRDLIAYRVKFHEHPMAGDAWCVYPSYDFEHCIVDALENITHSLCTLEFGLRRESYHWLLKALGIYRPVVWEYSRLNITHVVVSKRKLRALVEDGFVDGWDDPRMPTLSGLRRRGYTPAAINKFVDLVGVTRTENLVRYELLEHCLREDLGNIAERRMVVLDPLEVIIANVDAVAPAAQTVAAASFPNAAEGTPEAAMTYPASFAAGKIYIEARDFRLNDSKKYFGLAPGKVVRLRYGPVVRAVANDVDAAGNVTSVTVEIVTDESTLTGKSKKPKAIHWVGWVSPTTPPAQVAVRNYGVLFKSENVAAAPDWRADVNENSRVDLVGYVPPVVLNDLKVPEKHLQFERVGYYVTDVKSNALNQCCELKATNALF